MSHWYALAIALAVSGTAEAQTVYAVEPQRLLSHGADERLDAAELRAWYADLDGRVAGGMGAEALARARASVPDNGNFETMRERDAVALVDAHDALVEALALPPSERLACRREALVGSHVPVVTCRVAGRRPAATRDHAALR